MRNRVRPRRAGGPSSLDLRVLVLHSGADDPTSRAWLATLETWGVSYEAVIPAADRPLTVDQLVHDERHGRFNAVVLTTDSSAFWPSLPALREYRHRFGVRQVNGFEYPRPVHGLQEVHGRPLDGHVGVLTPTGRRHLGYLVGEVPLDPGTFGYLSAVSDPGVFTSLVETRHHEPLVGIATAPDGLEDMVLTVNYSEAMLHWRLLARGAIDWVTRGCHLGMSRYHLSCHVDDVLLPNSKSRPGSAGAADGSTVRMTADDVESTVAWQKEQGFTLDLAFNGYGAGPVAEDSLTAALVEHRHEFRWVNHTWSHVDMGTTVVEGRTRWRGVASLCEEIERNSSWATAVGIPASSTALVTGCHSGLDNPHLDLALDRAGITAIATDSSRRPQGRAPGRATRVPRHPTNIFTHVTTWPELLREYRAHYPDVVPLPGTESEFLEREERMVLSRVLSGDPGPLFAHQSNLADDRLLLRLLESCLGRYRAYLGPTAPLVNLSMDEIAAELRRRAAWRGARREHGMTATVDSRGRVVLASPVDVEIPLALPADSVWAGGWPHRHPFGEPYAGTRSGWHRLPAGEVSRLIVPRRNLAW